MADILVNKDARTAVEVSVPNINRINEYFKWLVWNAGEGSRYNNIIDGSTNEKWRGIHSDSILKLIKIAKLFELLPRNHLLTNFYSLDFQNPTILQNKELVLVYSSTKWSVGICKLFKFLFNLRSCVRRNPVSIQRMTLYEKSFHWEDFPTKS